MGEMTELPDGQERREGGYVLQAQLLSMTGHDRDCALAMLSQAEHGRPLDNIQVVHLLLIGRRAGYQAGREDAAREIEAAQLVKVCRYVGNFTLPGKHADHVCESEAGHSYPWHKCACGAMYQGIGQSCSCPDVDVSTFLDGPVPRTVKGRPDPSCPVHGNEINLGRSSRGVGDNTEEQQQEDGRG